MTKVIDVFERYDEKFTMCIGHESVDPVAVISLYAANGWGSSKDYHIKSVAIALERTTTVLTVYNSSSSLTGLARIFSDGLLYTCLAEILVLPQYQKQGIGAALIARVCELYRNTPIFLEALPNQHVFFHKQGFNSKPNMTVMSKRASH